MSFLSSLRRRHVAPVEEQCNQAPGCTNKAVSFETPMGEWAADYDRQVRRCIDHPPPLLAASVMRGDTCSHCGRGYWPDTMHLDCYGDEPDRDVVIGCQRATTAVEDEADPA